MVDTDEIKDYLQKLKRVIRDQSDFVLGNKRFIKAARLQDIMCCILAKLPESYKKTLKIRSEIKRYDSVMMFGLLTKAFSKKFFLDNSLCIIDFVSVNKLIDGISSSIVRDIRSIEGISE